MSITTVKKFVLTPIVLSAGVFCVLTLPLNLFGSKPVTIQVQKEPLFFGQLKDFAPQYLAVTGILSFGTGFITLAMIGWQHSSRNSVQVKEKISNLERNLKEKQKLLEAIHRTQMGLEAANSNEASEAQVIQQPTPVRELDVQTTSFSFHEDVEKQSNSPSFTSISAAVEPVAITTQPIEPQPVVPEQVKVQAAAAKFTSAQTFLGYTQVKDSVQPSPVESSLIATSAAEELDNKLQQIMEQVSSLQQTLRSNVQTVNFEKQPTSQQRPSFSVLKKYG